MLPSLSLRRSVVACLLACATAFPLYAASPDNAATEQLLRQSYGHANEAASLREAFLERPLLGDLPERVKQRFGLIASGNDVSALLATWQHDAQASRRLAAATLLRALRSNAALPVYRSAYAQADAETRAFLLDLTALLDSPAAFEQLQHWLAPLASASDERSAAEVIVGLSAAERFRHPLVQEKARSLLQGSAWQQTLGVTVLAAQNTAPARDALRGYLAKPGAAADANAQALARQALQAAQKPQAAASAAREASADSMAVAEASGDLALVQRIAPLVRLSSGSLNLASSSYAYADYLPITVSDILSYPGRLPTLVSGSQTTPLSLALLNSLDQNTAAGSYLNFKPLYASNPDNTISKAYTKLTLHPALYYKVFRNSGEALPTAVQFWFFYFNNDWLNDHPGDWESVTYFLDANENIVEAAYSTHYEANRLSWRNVSAVNGRPNVFVSSGGHGSYAYNGSTDYSVIPGIARDNHKGDKQLLYPAGSGAGSANDTAYVLIDLSAQGWLNFAGRFGDASSAPKGPRLRTDAPTQSDWNNAKNKPRDKTCAMRLGAPIYGNSSTAGPWYWAAGYGLDGAACVKR